MKKYKIIISGVLSMALSVSSVFAATITEKSAEISSDGKSVTVKATVDGDAGNVVVKVMKEGAFDTSTDVDAIKALEIVDMYNKTELSATFNFADELLPGRYYIYLSGEKIATSADDYIEKWYQTSATKNALISAINAADTTNHQSVMFDIYSSYDDKSYDRADVLSLKNALYKDAYDVNVSAFMLAARPAGGWNHDGVDLSQKFIEATAVAALTASNFKLEWTDATTSKLTTEIWGESDANTSMVKAQYYFNNTLSKAGRDAVINTLSGKSYTTLADFEKLFAQAVMYNGVYKANEQNSGHGHYPTLIGDLTIAVGYTSQQGKTFSTYTSLTAEQKSDAGVLLRQTATSDFQTMANKLLDEICPAVISGGTKNEKPIGGGGGGGSFVVSSTPPTIIPNVPTTFNDIDSVSWAKEAILSLKEKNIVSGTGNGTFEPNRAVKREEFLKMLITALNIPVGDSDTSFTDIDKNAWYAPYIAAALNMEITFGMGDGTFGIGKPLTREQCCTFIYRACKDRNFTGEEKFFTDSDKVSEFAKESVKALSSAGIIVGDENGNFNPTDNITRAQTAVMIYRLISGGNA